MLQPKKDFIYMKKVSIVMWYDWLQNNYLFNEQISIDKDNVLSKYIELKREFERVGFTVNTDIADLNLDSSDIILYYSLPKKLPNDKNVKKSFLIIEENFVIKPGDYDKKYHAYFNKIFTFDDALVDNKKYFKFNHSHLFPKKINKDWNSKKKLCVNISANKKSIHPLSLYKERVDTIRWFEHNHPNDFDLYGSDWDKYIFSGPLLFRVFNRFDFIQKIMLRLGNTFSSYKGTLVTKKETLQKYKFSICYENTKDVPGYISEKIFDCFFAGCVPIYWGACNINKYIPANCYIDKRGFSSHRDLYKYISSINKKTYLKYLDNIEKFILSNNAEQFKSRYYAKNLVCNIIND